MNDKEYTYNIDKYTIGVDENGEDGIGLTVAIIKNGELHFLGDCYGENARCIDLLIKENQKLKKQLEERNIEYFKGAYDTHNKCYDQQQEFIKWLEDKIERKRKNATCTFEYNDTVLPLKEVLQKYKEITGVSDEKK